MDRFAISKIGSQVAGSVFMFAVTAVDSSGRTDSGYTDTVAISTNNIASPAGQAVVLPATYTFTAADAGQHVFSAKMYNARSGAIITVTGDGRSVTSNTFSVSPSSVTIISTKSVSFSAQAHDQYGNPIGGVTYAWVLGVPPLGTIVPPPSAASATFTAAGVSGAIANKLSVSATYGGATATGSANLTVSPA